uniref:Uncharacterized protein n=1 Tax=viral metagenome TaxID=1070528 RepID=A0A6C0B354_9ZZZZ
MINHIIKEYSVILDIFSKIIILRSFYISFSIFFLYNLPVILSYRILLNGEKHILKTILYSLFNIFYKSPVYIMLYIYVNRSLKKYLQLYKGSDAPRHLFSTILINLTYFMIYITYYLTSGFIATIPMAFIYSLYISDLSYSFIDNSGYNFKNPITFYNSNYIFFCVLGTIYSFIEYFYLLHYDLEIVGLFIYILLCFPLLITYKYKNTIDSYSLFYIPEKLLTSII